MPRLLSLIRCLSCRADGQTTVAAIKLTHLPYSKLDRETGIFDIFPQHKAHVHRLKLSMQSSSKERESDASEEQVIQELSPPGQAVLADESGSRASVCAVILECAAKANCVVY